MQSVPAGRDLGKIYLEVGAYTCSSPWNSSWGAHDKRHNIVVALLYLYDTAVHIRSTRQHWWFTVQYSSSHSPAQ